MRRGAEARLMQLSDALVSVRRGSLSCLFWDVSISSHGQEGIVSLVGNSRLTEVACSFLCTVTCSCILAMIVIFDETTDISSP